MYKISFKKGNINASVDSYNDIALEIEETLLSIPSHLRSSVYKPKLTLGDT